jgi:hypothetical protein
MLVDLRCIDSDRRPFERLAGSTQVASSDTQMFVENPYLSVVLRRQRDPAPIMNGVLRVVPVPGPAHKQFITFEVGPGLTRVVAPLNGIEGAAQMRLYIEGLWPGVIDIVAVRVLLVSNTLRSLGAAGKLFSRIRALPSGNTSRSLGAPRTLFSRTRGFVEISKDEGYRVRCLADPLVLQMESEHFRDVGESTKLELTFRLTRIEPQALLSQPDLDAMLARFRAPWLSGASA